MKRRVTLAVAVVAWYYSLGWRHQASPGSSLFRAWESYRERPSVHSYDRCKGSFYSRSERSSLWALRHRYIYEWITLALSIIAHRAPREAAVQPPCRQTHRLCETQEDDTADRSDQFVTKNSSLNLF
jgi:hypothetical protein